eukprot:scaffold168025_cov39-Tisochrysis_lutea.AAC.4
MYAHRWLDRACCAVSDDSRPCLRDVERVSDRRTDYCRVVDSGECNAEPGQQPWLRVLDRRQFAWPMHAEAENAVRHSVAGREEPAGTLGLAACTPEDGHRLASTGVIDDMVHIAGDRVEAHSKQWLTRAPAELEPAIARTVEPCAEREHERRPPE